MRDPGVIDALDALERYARVFDAISRESDAHYSARSIVRRVRLKTTVPTYGDYGEAPDEAQPALL